MFKGCPLLTIGQIIAVPVTSSVDRSAATDAFHRTYYHHPHIKPSSSRWNHHSTEPVPSDSKSAASADSKTAAPPAAGAGDEREDGSGDDASDDESAVDPANSGGGGGEEDESTNDGSGFQRSDEVRYVYFQVTEMDVSPLNPITPISAVGDASQPGSSAAALRLTHGFVNPNHTLLIQRGTVNSRVPYAVPNFLIRQTEPIEPPPLSWYHSIAVPPSLAAASDEPNSAAAKEVIELLRPSLHALSVSFRVRSSILLCGARRSRKRATCMAVAHHFGMHYFEKNCYDLIGGSEAQTEKNVRAMLLQCTQYAPVIVHIRRLGAIKGLAPPLAVMSCPSAAFHVLSRVFPAFLVMCRSIRSATEIR